MDCIGGCCAVIDLYSDERVCNRICDCIFPYMVGCAIWKCRTSWALAACNGYTGGLICEHLFNRIAVSRSDSAGCAMLIYD